jgi:hypothetical protein
MDRPFPSTCLPPTPRIHARASTLYISLCTIDLFIHVWTCGTGLNMASPIHINPSVHRAHQASANRLTAYASTNGREGRQPWDAGRFFQTVTFFNNPLSIATGVASAVAKMVAGPLQSGSIAEVRLFLLNLCVLLPQRDHCCAPDTSPLHALCRRKMTPTKRSLVTWRLQGRLQCWSQELRVELAAVLLLACLPRASGFELW